MIKRLLTEIENHEQAQANINSASTAQLCSLVRIAMHVFAHASGPVPDAEPKKFMPFPEWEPLTARKEKPKGPSEMTKLVLKEALRRGEIPLFVYVGLSSPPEDDS